MDRNVESERLSSLIFSKNRELIYYINFVIISNDPSDTKETMMKIVAIAEMIGEMGFMRWNEVALGNSHSLH